MKKKNEFPKLDPYNPFSPENTKTMVCKEWSNFNEFRSWRLNYLKDINCPEDKYDQMDVDDIIKQWDIDREKRICNKNTCIVIDKNLALIIRRIEAELYYARINNTIPGVIKSSRSDKYLCLHITTDGKIKTMISNTEESAYEHYCCYRTVLLTIVAKQSFDNKTLSKEDYDLILDTVKFKSYNELKNQE